MKNMIVLLMFLANVGLADPSCMLYIHDSNGKGLPPSIYSGTQVRYLNLMELKNEYSCGFTIKDGAAILACAKEQVDFNSFSTTLPMPPLHKSQTSSVFVMKDKYWVRISVSCRSN